MPTQLLFSLILLTRLDLIKQSAFCVLSRRKKNYNLDNFIDKINVIAVHLKRANVDQV